MFRLSFKFLTARILKNYNIGISKDNKGGIQLLGERALTEFGSNFEPRRSSVVSEASMNTQ